MVDKKDILHFKDIQRTFTIAFKKLTVFTFFDAPPNSLINSIANLNVKIAKG
jgi:hypothetical protein